MAKVGMWLKGARGRLAGNSLSKGANGQTIIREIVTPSNPKTASQCLQRAVFNTATQAASVLAPIVDHSFQGVKYGNNSVNHFLKLNLDKLRASAIREITGDGIETANFNTKGFNFCQPNAYVVSEGSMVFPNYHFAQQLGFASARLDISSDITLNDLDSETDYAKFLSYFGLEPGDQLTVVALECDPSQNESMQMIADDPSSVVNLSKCLLHVERLVFKTSVNESTSFIRARDNFTLFREEILDLKRTSSSNGIFLPCRTPANPIALSIEPSPGMQVVALAVIRSQRSRKGKWMRSDATMVFNDSINAAAKYAMVSYAKNASSTMESDFTLNNALQAPTATVNSATPANVQNVQIVSNNLTDINVDYSNKHAYAKVVDGHANVNFTFDSNLGVDEVQIEIVDHDSVHGSPTYYKENGKWHVSLNITSIGVGGGCQLYLQTVGSTTSNIFEFQFDYPAS